MALTSLATYFVLFTVTAFVGDPLKVAEIFRSPDIEATLYFTFIILTDAPISPARYPRPGYVRRISRGGELCILFIDRSGSLFAGARDNQKCVGGMAQTTGPPIESSFNEQRCRGIRQRTMRQPGLPELRLISAGHHGHP
jgi:hypothetical protein